MSQFLLGVATTVLIEVLAVVVLVDLCDRKDNEECCDYDEKRIKELVYYFENKFCRRANNKKCTKDCKCYLYNEQGGFVCLLDVIEALVKEKVTEDFKYKDAEKEKVIYLCDHRACKECGGGLCNHTDNIEHAKNFEKIGDAYFEKE